MDFLPFSSAGIDRADHLRDEADALAGRDDARLILFHDLRPLVQLETPRLARLSLNDPRADQIAPRIFLGLDDQGPLFAQKAILDSPADEGQGWQDARSLAMKAALQEAGLLAQAKSLVDWHDRHGFCARCGAITQSRHGGWRRVCLNPACGAEHFPRTDPVVMMWITCQDQALVARGPHFPLGMMSALAGFMEPGETIEDAVRREAMEEVGLSVDSIRYAASQAWPFPSSLMIGCFAEAQSQALRLDAFEIEVAEWLSRDEVTARLLLSHSLPREDNAPRLPPPISLAHYLARLWLGLSK